MNTSYKNNMVTNEFQEIQDLINNRIIQITIVKNISMKQLSLSIGKSSDYIQKVISGKIIPRLPVLLDICNQLDISIVEMFDQSIKYPNTYHRIIENLKNLPEEKLKAIDILIK